MARSLFLNERSPGRRSGLLSFQRAQKKAAKKVASKTPTSSTANRNVVSQASTPARNIPEGPLKQEFISQEQERVEHQTSLPEMLSILQLSAQEAKGSVLGQVGAIASRATDVPSDEELRKQGLSPVEIAKNPMGLGAGVIKSAINKAFPGSLEKIQDDAQAIREGANAISQEANRLRRDLDPGKVEQFMGDASATFLQSIPSAAAAITGGLPLAAVVGGMQTYGSVVNEAAQKLRQEDPDLTVGEAEEQAHIPALASGIGTAATVGLFGKTGLEALSRLKGQRLAQALEGAPIHRVRDVFASGFRSMGFEAGQETLDQTIQEAIAKASFDPEKTFSEAAANASYAALLGGFTGGAFGIPVASLEYIGNRAKRDVPDKTKEGIKRIEQAFLEDRPEMIELPEQTATQEPEGGERDDRQAQERRQGGQQGGRRPGEDAGAAPIQRDVSVPQDVPDADQAVEEERVTPTAQPQAEEGRVDIPVNPEAMAPFLQRSLPQETLTRAQEIGRTSEPQQAPQPARGAVTEEGNLDIDNEGAASILAGRTTSISFPESQAEQATTALRDIGAIDEQAPPPNRPPQDVRGDLERFDDETLRTAADSMDIGVEEGAPRDEVIDRISETTAIETIPQSPKRRISDVVEADEERRILKSYQSSSRDFPFVTLDELSAESGVEPEKVKRFAVSEIRRDRAQPGKLASGVDAQNVLTGEEIDVEGFIVGDEFGAIDLRDSTRAAGVRPQRRRRRVPSTKGAPAAEVQGRRGTILTGTGKRQIRSVLEQSNLDQSIKDVGFTLLDMLPEKYLKGMRFEVDGTDAILGRVRDPRQPEGTFNQTLRMAKVLEDAQDPTVAAHEISHGLATFLPDSIRTQLANARMEEVRNIDPENLQPASRELLDRLRNGERFNGTQFANNFFHATDNQQVRNELRDLYRLTNEDEYLASGIQEIAKQKTERPAIKNALDYIKDFVRRMIDAAKTLFGKEKLFDNIWRNFEQGNWDPNVEQGLLFDENRSKEVQSFTIKTPKQAERAIKAAERREAKQRRPRAKGFEVARIQTQISGLSEIIDEYITEDTPAKSLDLLGKFNIDEIQNVMENMTSPETWAQVEQITKNHSIFPYLSSIRAVYWSSFFGKLNKVVEDAKNVEDAFKSDKMRKAFEEHFEKQKAKDMAKQAEAEFETAVKQHIKAARQQFEQEVKAGSASEALQREIEALEKQLDFSKAVSQAVKAMADVLSQDPEGLEFLYYGSEKQVRRMKNLFKKLKKQQREQGLEVPAHNENDTVIEWAAYVLGRGRNIAEQLAAQEFIRNTQGADRLFDEIQTEFIERFKKNPAEAVKKLLVKQKRLRTQRERAEAAFVALDKRLSKEAKDFAVYQEARRIAESVLNDKRFRDEFQKARRQGKVQVRPEKFEKANVDQIMNYAVFPDGSVTPVSWDGDADSTAHRVETFQKARDSFWEWLQKDENKNDPYREYFESVYQMYQHFHTSSIAWHPSRIIDTNFLSWNMMKFVIDELGTAMGGLLRVQARKWSKAFKIARDIQIKYQYRLVNARKRAVESHGLKRLSLVDEPGVGKKYGKRLSAFEASEAWYEEIGRELYDSWQNVEGGLNVGDTTSKGYVITQEDVDEIRLAGAASRELYQMLSDDPEAQKRVSLGARNVLPATIKEADGGELVFREPRREGPGTTPRRFNRQAITLFRRIKRLRQQGQSQQAANLLESQWDFIQSFLNDRDFTAVTGESKYEEAYTLIAQELQENPWPIEEQTLAEVARQVSNITGVDENEVYNDMFGEFNTIMNRVLTDFPEENLEPGNVMDIDLVQHRNSFNQSRKRKIAPYWVYDTGFADSQSFQNFTMSAPSYHFENLIQDLRKTRQAMQDRLTDFQKSIEQTRQETQVSPQKARRAVVKTQQQENRFGANIDRWDTLEKQVAKIDSLIDAYQRVYGERGQMEDRDISDLVRASNTVVGAVLINVTTFMRNFGFGPYYLGALTNRVQDTMLKNYFGAAWTVFKQLPRFMVEPVVRKGESTIKSMFSDKQLQKFDKAVDEVAPHFQKESDRWLRSVELYRVLDDRGMMTPTDTRFEVPAKFQSVSSGGFLKEDVRSDNKFLKIVKGSLMTAAMSLDAALISPIGRKFFPRAADVMVNTAAAEYAFQVSDQIQKQLNRFWDAYQRGNLKAIKELDFKDYNSRQNDIEPQMVFPQHWFDGPRDQGSLTFLRQTFEESNIDLQWEVMKYLDEVRKADDPESLQFMDNETRFNLADVMMQDINQMSVLNRPPFTRRGGLWAVLSALHGWNLSTFRNWQRLHMGIAAESPQKSRFKQKFQLFTFMVAAMGAGAMLAGGTEKAIDFLRWLLANEVRPNRDPWDEPRTVDQAKQVVMEWGQTAPYVGDAANYFFNDLPGRGSVDYTPFIISKAMDWGSYAAGVAKTGDPTYNFEYLAKGTIPLTRIAVNRMPGVNGKLDAMNARRLLTNHGPKELLKSRIFEMKAFSSMSTPGSPYADKMLNAAMKEDWENFNRHYENAVAVEKKGGELEPEKVVVRNYMNRNPYKRAFRRLPTEEERTQILSQMNEAERAMVEDVERRFDLGASNLGKTANFTQEDSMGKIVPSTYQGIGSQSKAGAKARGKSSRSLTAGQKASSRSLAR